MNTVNNTNNIRIIGIFSIVLAAINFMVNGRYDLNSINTHYIFLGVNFLLAILGYISGKLMQDYKTSRIFISLSLALVPVHMAQLGGFIQSKFASIDSNLPDVFNIAINNNASLGIATIITIVLLSPITLLGFNILDRKHAKQNTLFFLIGSFLILYPSRESVITFILIFICLALNYFYSFRESKLLTIESKVAAAIVILPLCIMFGRLTYYPQDELFVMITSLSCAISMHYFENNIDKNSNHITTLNFLGMCSWGVLTFGIISYFNLVDFSYFAFILASFLNIGSLLSRKKNKGVRIFSAVLNLMGLLSVVLTFDITANLIAMIFPLISVTIGFVKKEKISFLLSIFTLVAGFINMLFDIISIPSIGTWQYLMSAGILLILSSGIYEKRKDKLRHYYLEFMKTFN